MSRRFFSTAPMARFALRAAYCCVVSVATLLATVASAQGPNILFLEETPGESAARLLFLPDDRAELEAAVPPGEARLLVTGAYSSGDDFRPEGFTIRAGRATRPHPQGWDGLLTIDQAGRAQIFFVEDVDLSGGPYNLRDSQSLAAFVAMAQAERLSVVQSHLLIRDGALDLRPVDGAPIARRRILFQTADGRLGVYDSAPALLTLYEAAVELQERAAPVMAFNLDMGTYDFCEVRTSEGPITCGVLRGDQIDGRLTNVLELTTSRGDSP